jgi:hypothetical protein
MDPNAKEPTISAYAQCYSNKRALYEAFTTFRRFYETEPLTLVSDCGEDFSRFSEHFNLHYYRSEKSADPGNLGKDGVRELLRRIYEHCLRVSSDYVVILEEDVMTRRRIKHFPLTDCGGPRLNRLADPMNRYLQKLNNSTLDYGYVLCGASIFRRSAFIHSYEMQNLDLDFLRTLDERVVIYADAVLTVMFLINGYSSGVWEEVSETKHPKKGWRIFRDSAFDHADKTWYGMDLDESVFDV